MTDEIMPFTRHELLALPATDLGDLLRLTGVDDVWEAARALGLDPAEYYDRHAVERAWWAKGLEPDPFGPVIGSDPEGVRRDLTPTDPADRTGVDGNPDQAIIDLGTIEATPDGARDIAAMMDASVASGEPFMAGTFAMYAAPDGSVVMVTEGIGEGVRRSVVPRRWVRSALQLMAGEGGGLKMRMLGKLFNG
jgi:hypothetical protein